MSFDAGTRIGKYEIQALIGEGGMGHVFRALDTELRRVVALKFLPADVAADPRRLERFGREALAVSALNHPNILTVHDIGQTEDGRRFFATEFVDGVTLREHSKGHRLKLGEVLDLLAQVAGALVEAHAHGVVHRDIKPENVMVRRDGYVKVLDFGLAKLTGNPSGGVDTEAATRALAVTDAGAVMGTVSYMSPEQTRGEEVDARTDVWSLGVVLYELLTGHAPFRGRSASHTLVAIQDDEPPPLAAYLPEAPDLLQEVVSDALAKDREARLTAKQMLAKLQRLKRRLDAGANLDRSVAPDAPAASGEVSGGATRSQPGTTAGGLHQTAAVTRAEGTQTTTAGERAKARGGKRLLAAVALAALVLAGGGFALYKLFGRGASAPGRSVAPLQSMKFTKLPVSGDLRESYISPDGRFIARVVFEKNQSSLLLRQVSGTTEREIVPPSESYFLGGAAFSPDGNNIYYVTGETGKNFRRLYRVSVLGGDPRKLIEDVDSGVTLSPDGKRLAFRRHMPRTREDTLVVANEDGSAEQVIATRQAPVTFGLLAWSPDGQLIAHTVHGKDDEGNYSNIEATALSDRSTKVISAERWRWLSSLLWLPEGDGLVVTGKGRASPPDERGQIWHVAHPSGEARKITNDANNYHVLSLTADARTALVLQSNVFSNVWVMPAGDFARARQITNTNAPLGELCWTADGRIIYSAGGPADLWVMAADGTANRQLTFTADRSEVQPSLSPDGRFIAFLSAQSGVISVWRMGLDGGGAKELARNVDDHARPQVSPDSQWVFYNSRDETGNVALWKIPAEGGAPSKVKSNVSGCRLAPEGKLFYCFYREPVPDADAKIVVVPAEGGEAVRTLDMPRRMGVLQVSPDGQALDFAASRDGSENIWRMPLAGGKEQKLTDWGTTEPLWWFAWSRDGKQLAVVRDTVTNELVLIKDFR